MPIFKSENRAVFGSPIVPQPPTRLAFLVGPRLLASLLAALVVALIIGALGFEVFRLVSPPRLLVRSPAADETVQSFSIQVSGQTEREAILRLNGERIYAKDDGSFEETVNLHRGVNVIKIAAKKPHSEERVVYRRVLWPEEAVR
ncbi:hypothetical protein EPN90_03215 [Patescibacteria group bacterium]|nr:MAG: hypothetical protein EPN90_03215 [Patescibacteria group bacterium]